MTDSVTATATDPLEGNGNNDQRAHNKTQYEDRTQTAWSDAAAGETQSEMRTFLFGLLK